MKLGELSVTFSFERIDPHLTLQYVYSAHWWVDRDLHEYRNRVRRLIRVNTNSWNFQEIFQTLEIKFKIIISVQRLHLYVQASPNAPKESETVKVSTT